jgi:hypothetical protein
VREPVYQMLLVRCPECSTPAAVQEYPVIGPWAARLAGALAAFWLVLLVILLFASAGVFLGLAYSAAQEAGGRMATVIGNAQRQWYDGLDDKGRALVSQWVAQNMKSAPSEYTWIDHGWWTDEDRRALLARAGGWRHAIDWSATAEWPADLLGAAIIGAIWAVFLLGLKRRRVLLAVVAPALLAAALLYNFGGPSPSRFTGGAILSYEAAFEVVGWWFFLFTLGVMTLGAWVGACVGRPLARLLARALLPPRTRSALAFLWTADGLPPPRPKRPA